MRSFTGAFHLKLQVCLGLVKDAWLHVAPEDFSSHNTQEAAFTVFRHPPSTSWHITHAVGLSIQASSSHQSASPVSFSTSLFEMANQLWSRRRGSHLLGVRKWVELTSKFDTESSDNC